MEDVHKGFLLGEFKSNRFQNKNRATLYRCMELLVFLNIPMSIYSLSSRIPGWNEHSIYYGIIVAIFIIDIIAIIIADGFLSPNLSPIKIYSQGIEKKRTILDRLRKNDGFYSRSSIEKVVLMSFNKTNSFGKPNGKMLIFSLFLKGGRQISLGDRGTENTKKIQELLTRDVKIPVFFEEWGNQNGHLVQSSNSVGQGYKEIPSEVAVPVQNPDMFCIQCGAKIEIDSKFCGYCGWKQQ